MTRFTLFDRWENQIGTVSGIVSAKHSDEAGGEDTLTIKAEQPLSKGQRIVWADGRGLWHEHIVDSTLEEREGGGRVYTTATCSNSISETWGDYIDDLMASNYTATAALTKALSPTRWKTGQIEELPKRSTSWYHISAREAIQDIAAVWGCEIETLIEVEGSRVSARKVSLRKQRGTDTGKRFAWEKDLSGVTRAVETDAIITALYGYGKGVQTGDGYGPRLDFAAINGGKKYAADEEARKLYGRADGAHVYGHIEYDDCEDQAELLRLTTDELAKQSKPRVSYEATVEAYARAGFDFEGVYAGDVVALIDRGFSPEVRVQGRALKVVRDLLNESGTDITVGNITDDTGVLLAAQQAKLSSLTKRATNWDVAASTPSAYINQIMNGLNSEFDSGASYIYQSPENGIIVGSVPLDPSNGRPTRTPASAIQLKGGGFRIANKAKSDGEWDWRTFGTGAGFTADEIVAGVLRGQNIMINLNDGTVEFKRGVISDVAGSMSIDLNEGAISMRDGYYYMDIDPKFGIELLYKDATRSMPIFSTKQRAVKNGNVSTVFASGITTSGLLLDDAFSADSESLPIAMIKGSTLHHQDTGSKSGAISFRVYKEPTGQDSLNTAAYMGLSELGWEVGIGSMKNASSTRIMVTKDSVYVTGNLVVNGKLIS